MLPQILASETESTLNTDRKGHLFCDCTLTEHNIGTSTNTTLNHIQNVVAGILEGKSKLVTKTKFSSVLCMHSMIFFFLEKTSQESYDNVSLVRH